MTLTQVAVLVSHAAIRAWDVLLPGAVEPFRHIRRDPYHGRSDHHCSRRGYRGPTRIRSASRSSRPVRVGTTCYDMCHAACMCRFCSLVRLARHAKSLKTLLSTLMLTLPSVANISMLLFLVYFVYAIIGCEPPVVSACGSKHIHS